MTTTVVKIDDLSKRFVIHKDKSIKERILYWNRSAQYKEDFWALQHINLEIESGSTVGLVGPNGSGKSTLLKMIGGILQPTFGSVLVRGRIAALLELGAGFHPDLTGRENVYLNASILGLSKSQTDQYFDEIVDFSGIGQFIDTQVKFYSSGMYVRLAFAVATYVDPDILLVDEVLSVGDEPFQQKCMDRIRQFQADGRTIVVVTHSLGQVAELCDRAVVLKQGEILADGPPLTSLRALRSEFDQARAEELDRVHSADDAAEVVDPETGAIEIVSTRPRVSRVELLDANSNVISEMGSATSEATIAVTVDCPVPMDDLIVGCSIVTPKGMVVYSTSTKLLEQPLAAAAGAVSCQFHLQDLNLNDGMYHLHGSVASPSGELDKLRDSYSFSVIGDGRTTGIIAPQTTLDVVIQDDHAENEVVIHEDLAEDETAYTNS